MINNMFDKFFKDTLGNSRPDVPAHIWENIVAQKQHKAPGFFGGTQLAKFVAATLLILAATGGILFIITKKQDEKTGDINVNTVAQNKSKSNKNQSTVTPQNKIIDNNDIVNPIENIEGNTSNRLTVPTKKQINVTIAEVMYEEENTNINLDKSAFLNYSFLNLQSNINKKQFNPGLQYYKNPKYPFIPCPEIEKNAAGSKRYFEVYGGPDYVFNNLTDTANSVYLKQRKNSTKYLFAYSAGVRYTKVFKNGMSIRTGLNYSQINEKFTAEKGRVIQNVYITNNNGDTTGSYVQTGTQYKTSTNKYKTIDIPISVGYELGNGKLHTNINVGAVVNISSSQKGFVLDKSGNAVDISSGNNSSVYQYKTRAGVSFLGAASIYYKLNETVHLMAEPYVKLALNPATKPEISLEEKFHTTGLRLGVRMDF